MTVTVITKTCIISLTSFASDVSIFNTSIHLIYPSGISFDKYWHRIELFLETYTGSALSPTFTTST